MALTDTEIVTTAEIVGELYAVAQWYAQNLTAGQEASLRADIATWTSIRDKHTVIEGGGVKINPADKRAAITRRVRKMLRFEDAGSGSVRIMRG
jgi:hypothetical protein